MKVAIAVFFAVLIAVWVFLFIRLANAEYLAENWKGYEITPAQKDAIRRARIPGQGIDCCGIADGIPVEFDIKEGHYWANWDGGWRPIPGEKIVKDLNVSFPILWVTKSNRFETTPQGGYKDMGYRDVRCFWPGAGG